MHQHGPAIVSVWEQIGPEKSLSISPIRRWPRHVLTAEIEPPLRRNSVLRQSRGHRVAKKTMSANWQSFVHGDHPGCALITGQPM